MKRPWEVTMLAVLAFAAATIAILVSVSLLAPGTRLDRMWELNIPAHDAFAPGQARLPQCCCSSACWRQPPV